MKANKLAVELSVDIKPNPAAKIAPVALENETSIENVMKMFSSARAGGFALEDQLDEIAKLKGPIPAADVQKYQTFANKLGAIGHFAESFPPAVNIGKKNILCIII